MICQFFDYLSSFWFLLIEFYCTFFISYKILEYYVYYYYILIRMWQADRTTFFCAHFASFHTHASLLTFFICLFILFHSFCSHARMFLKTLMDEFPISYSHTEWDHRVDSVIESSLEEIVGSKNFALTNLSWKFTEVIM